MAVTPRVEPQGASRKQGTCRKCSKPTKGHWIDSVMNSQMKQAVSPKQDCAVYIMLRTQKEHYVYIHVPFSISGLFLSQLII